MSLESLFDEKNLVKEEQQDTSDNKVNYDSLFNPENKVDTTVYREQGVELGTRHEKDIEDYFIRTGDLEKATTLTGGNLNYAAGLTIGVSPQEVADAKKFAADLQLPESVVSNNIDLAREKIQSNKLLRTLEERISPFTDLNGNTQGAFKYPKTREFLYNPGNMAAFKDKGDDLVHLEEIQLRESSPFYKSYFVLKEKTKDIISSGLSNTQAAFELIRKHPSSAFNAVPGVGKLAVGLVNSLSEENAQTFVNAIKKGRDYLKQDMFLDETGFSKYLYDAIGILPQVGAAYLTGGGALWASGIKAGAKAAASTLSRSGAVFMGSYIFGSDYGRFRDEGISPERAAGAALGDALVQGYIEEWQIGSMFKMFKATGSTNVLKQGLENLITQWGGEFLQSVPESISSIWADAEIKGYSIKDQVNIFVDNLGETLTQGAYEGLLMAPFAILGTGASIANYRRGIINNNKALKDRADLIKKNKLTQRGVNSTGEFVNNTTDIKKTYMGVEQIGEYFENDSKKIDEFLDKMKIRDNFNKAITENTDVEIDTGRLLSVMSEDQDTLGKMINGVSFEPGGENFNEASAKIKEDGKEKAKVEESKTIRIFKNKLRKKTKLLDTEIEAAGSLLDSLANVASENFGVDKDQYLKSLNLKFETIDKGERIGKIGGETDTITRTVTLFQDADIKTVIHEAGHLFKSELEKASKLKSAPGYLKEDLKALNEYTKGLKDNEAQEKIAEAFTKYIEEGKAPTKKLKSAFIRMKNWLISIYKRTKGTVGGDTVLNDDVRGVFDRMLATQEELDEMEKSSFDTEIDKGISDIVNDKYADEELAKIYNDSREEAIKGEVKRAKANYAKTVESTPQMRKRIMEDIARDPVYMAIDQVIKNGGVNPEVVAYYSGANLVESFKKHKDFINNNVSIDETVLEDAIAENYTGFNRVDEFLDKVLEINDKTTEIRERVAKEKENFIQNIEEELREKEGFITNEERIYNDKRIDYIAKKANMLANKISKDTGESVKRLNKKILEKTAAQELSSLPLKDIKAEKYIRMSQKHARLANEALKEKDIEKAKELIKRQATNLVYAREAFKIGRRAATLTRKTKSYAAINSKLIDSEYHNVLIDMANRLGLSDKKLRPGKFNKTEIIKELKGNVMIDYHSNPILEGNSAVKINNLNLKDITKLQTDLNIIAKAGKDIVSVSKFLSKEFPGMTINDLVEASVHTMEKVKPKREYAKGIRQKVGSVIEHIVPMTQELDGFTRLKDGKPGFVELLIRRSLDIKGGQLYDKREETKKKLEPHQKIIRKAIKRLGNRFDGIEIEGVPLPEKFKKAHTSFVTSRPPTGWNADRIIAVTFNYMNEGNRQALEKGWGITNDMALKIMGELNANELRAIQGMINVINDFFPELNRTYRSINNAHLEKIEAAPFSVTSADGELVHMSGGYYPIAVDFKTRTLTKKETEELMSGNKRASVYGDMAPTASATKQRKYASSPVVLDMTPLYRHIEETLRYTYMADIVTDLDKVMRDKRWETEAVRIIGKDKYDVLRETVRDIGLPKRTKTTLFDKLSLQSQSLYTVAKLGNKFTTAIKQVGSLASAIQEDPKSVLYGLAYVAKSVAHNPLTGFLDAYNFAKENSSFIREKGGNIEVGMEKVDRFSTKGLPVFDIPIGKGKVYTVTPTDMRDVAMTSIKMMDGLTVSVVWNGKYQRERARGVGHKEAVLLANEQVADTQPVFTELYRNLWQKGGKGRNVSRKMMAWAIMPFTGWTAKAHTRNSVYWRAFLNGQISFPKYAQHIMLERIIGPMAVNLAANMILGYNDDDDWTKDLLALAAYNVSGIPFVNILASWAMYGGKFAERKLPISEPILIVGKAFEHLFNGKGEKAGLDMLRFFDFVSGAAGENAVKSYSQIKELVEKK